RLQPARFCRRLQGGIPDIKAASGGRRLWPGTRADRQQLDIQRKQIAARLEQLKAGDGDHCLRLHLTGHEQAEVWTDAGRFAGSENEGAGSGHWHVLGMGGGCPSEMKNGVATLRSSPRILARSFVGWIALHRSTERSCGGCRKRHPPYAFLQLKASLPHRLRRGSDAARPAVLRRTCGCVAG